MKLKMRNIKIVFTITLLISLTSCTSIKLADNWKSADFSSVKEETILVIAKAKKDEIRKNYEAEIVKRLKGKGINAIELHKKYPELKTDKEKSPEETKQIVKMFQKDGINCIMITKLKDTKEEVKIITEGGNYYPTSTTHGKYNVTFNPNSYTDSYLSHRPDNPVKTTVLTTTTYFLEAITYNLALEKEKQLTSISLVTVKDPNSAEKVRVKFAKILAKQFK